MGKRLFGCFGFNDIPFTEGQLVDWVYADSPKVAFEEFMSRAVSESHINLIDFYNLDSYFFTLQSSSGFYEYRIHHTYLVGVFDRYRVFELSFNEVTENESC